MGWHSRDEDWQADRYHDDCKNDFDPLPARLAPKVTLAEQVAIAVKNTDNLKICGRLIEAYRDSENAKERLEAVAAGAGR